MLDKQHGAGLLATFLAKIVVGSWLVSAMTS